MLNFFKVLFVLLACQPVWSHSDLRDFVEISPSHRVFYRFDKAVGPEKGTLLLFSGLLYTDQPWTEYTERMRLAGYNVVRFDYSTRPVERTGLQVPPYYVQKSQTWGWPGEVGTDLKTLATDAQKVLEHLGITSPVTLVGLSFGALVATEFALLYPELSKKLFFMVPAIRPSQLYDPLFQMLGGPAYFSLGKVNPAIDYQYRLWLRSTIQAIMQKRILSSQPDDPYLPEGVSASSLLDSAYHLVRAVRYINLHEEVKPLSREIPISVMLTTEEPEAFRQDQLDFIETLRREGFHRVHVVQMDGANHVIPIHHPEVGAEVTARMLERPSAEEITISIRAEELARPTNFCTGVFSR